MPLASSIDYYIDSHPGKDEIALCGKLAIVRSILEAEKESCLFVNVSEKHSTLDLDSLNATLYLQFFKSLTENCGNDDVLKERLESIVLIVFNYDRCIEHFMYHALQIYYNISGDEAFKLISCINIYHPYGSVGSLPWYANGVGMGFGAEVSPNQLLHLAGKIKTFTEGTDPNSSEISEIRNHINTAHKLVFLGFAFHELNMELITSGNTGSSARQMECYATTYGFSESDKEAIKRQIGRLRTGFLTKMGMAGTGTRCAEFFNEFSKSLAF